MMRRLVVGALTTSVVVAVGMTAADAQEVFDHGPGGERYVALGDSAAAGPIILPQRAGYPCFRSERNTATGVATTLDVRAFTDVTCSSATFGNLTAPQDGELPQLDALRADTTLVTLGPLGANDAGIVSTVTGCLIPGCKERNGSSVHDKIEALRPVVAASLATIQRTSPNAAIVVVGYGRYVPDGGCPVVQPVTPSDADYIQGLINHANEVLATAAKKAGAAFADQAGAPDALAHTACALPGDRWFEGLVPLSLDGAIPFHPTALGMKATADTVLGVVPLAKSLLQARQLGERQDAARAQLTTAAKKLRGQAVCRAGKVRFRLLAGRAPVTRVDFRVSKKVLGHDRKTPFRLFVPRSRLAKRSGTFTARVRLTVPDATKTVTVKIRRPSCSRRV